MLSRGQFVFSFIGNYKADFHEIKGFLENPCGLSQKTCRSSQLYCPRFPEIPQKLFSLFKDRGVIITEKYPGIYYLTGPNIIFDTQVIVTRHLDSEKFPGLKILSDNAAEEDVRRFIEQAKKA